MIHMDEGLAEKRERQGNDPLRLFLRSKGWRFHSNNPAHIWVWNKTLEDGRQFMVTDDNVALKIEQALS